MVLSLDKLAKGKEITHDVEITSLGETIRIRELPAKELKALHAQYLSVLANPEDLDSEKNHLINTFTKTITDDDDGELTEEQAEAILENAPQSAVREIHTKIWEAHAGKGSGES